ncbi:MAG: 3-oxoacyl-[acyl-carrier-protein] reductase [Myxococcota bacterium]
MELQGKVAIVTGGSRGIGKAIAKALAGSGAQVVVGYASAHDEAKAVVDAIGGVAVQANVGTTEGCEALVAAADDWGGADILVNNAGVTADGLMLRMKDEAWDKVMNINAGGVFRMCRAALPAMVKKRGGSIINITSVSGVRGNPGQVNYSASKAAVIALTQSLSREMARRNIRVNAVAPGFIQTDMTDELTDAQREDLFARIPLRRMGKPEEIAHMVEFLAGPKSEYVTGQTFIVDGGLTV